MGNGMVSGWGDVSALKAGDLRRWVDPERLGFSSTAEWVTRPLPWIGQARAEQAARFGLQMRQRDYNLFVLGEMGSGRSTLLGQMMRAQAALRPVPPDLCFLNNFEDPARPLALRLPAGQGRALRQAMAQWVKRLQSDIPKRLAQEDFQVEKKRLEREYQAQENEEYLALSAYAEAHRFALMRDEGHMVFTLKDEAGEPITASKALAQSREQRAAMNAEEEALRVEISRYLDTNRALERVRNEGLSALRRQIVMPLLAQEAQAIGRCWQLPPGDAQKLSNYLSQVQQAVLEGLELFQPQDDEEVRQQALSGLLDLLAVNLAVDNHGLQGAPAMEEDNPLFRPLFGCIEYETDGGELVTDFSKIRAGSLLKAHGGFLMLHLRDLLADALVWEKLRRFLRNGRLHIEEPGMLHAPMAAVSLEPEAVDVDVKIVLVASVQEYYAVQEADPEFARRFRCKVDFAESFVATEQTMQDTAVLVAHTCARLGLLHFSAEAVALLVEETHRLADDQARQSALFGVTESWVLESHAMACERQAQSLPMGDVQAGDVRAAQHARLQRLNYPEQRLLETLTDGERLLSVTGQALGQVNGLTVLDMGDHRFGVPVRVTACTYAGEEGLLNIEREVDMSGPIHDKGVLILHGYLASLFAHMAPLAMNAAIVFEQEYSGVEGDSASCAEFYALLSSLSGLPLQQGLAVTGALNQHGELLPVGGINEKIEGYFRCCQALGLTGQQGVLMPTRNRRHLMLDPQVVTAVAQGRFHIHAVDRVGDGMALLTGWTFGERGVGAYAANTVLGRAQKTLQRYRALCEAAAPRHGEAAHHPKRPRC
jgi:predicted ATP-dependent protease